MMLEMLQLYLSCIMWMYNHFEQFIFCEIQFGQLLPFSKFTLSKLACQSFRHVYCDVTYIYITYLY